MDAGLFMFSPLPFVYTPSPQPARIHLQINLALPLAILFFSLSLLAAYPKKYRTGRDDTPHPQKTSTGSTSLSPRKAAATTTSISGADRMRLRLQRQNTHLTTSVRTLQLALRHNAFAAFRDRLLLSNRIWAQEKQIALMSSDTRASTLPSSPVVAPRALDPAIKTESSSPSADEQIRALEAKIVALEQARIADAAARDAMDERRELLVAKLIEEIAADLEESQRQVERLRAKLCMPAQPDGDAGDTEVVTSEKEPATEPVIEPCEPEEVKSDLDQTLCEEIWASKLSQAQAPYDGSDVPASPKPDGSALDDLFSDPGSPTSTVGDEDDRDIYDGETDYASDAMPESPLAYKLHALDSPPPTPRSSSPPPSPSPPSSGFGRPFPRARAISMMNLAVHPQSPGALALGGGEGPYTTSARLLARCQRAKSAIVSGRRALRFPTWSQQPSALGPVLEAGESTASVNIFPGRSTKRARANSESSVRS